MSLYERTERRVGNTVQIEYVPVEAEEAWLTFEDIGPSAVWVVNHEEQPDYMGADHVMIVKIGGSDDGSSPSDSTHRTSDRIGGGE